MVGSPHQVARGARQTKRAVRTPGRRRPRRTQVKMSRKEERQKGTPKMTRESMTQARGVGRRRN